MFKWQIAIDRHSPRLIILNQCHFSDPPHFSLLSTLWYFIFLLLLLLFLPTPRWRLAGGHYVSIGHPCIPRDMGWGAFLTVWGGGGGGGDLEMPMQVSMSLRTALSWEYTLCYSVPHGSGVGSVFNKLTHQSPLRVFVSSQFSKTSYRCETHSHFKLRTFRQRSLQCSFRFHMRFFL